MSVVGLVAGVVLRSTVESSPRLDDLRPYESSLIPLLGRQGSVADWGSKTLLLNFWGSWCPPCVAEMPLLDRFNEEFGEEHFQVVGIAIDEKALAERFMRDNDIGFLSFVAVSNAADELMDLLGNDDSVLPFSVVFSPDGTVGQVIVGEIEESDLRELVSR